MSKSVYENKFKSSLLQFLDELIEQYPTYPSIVIVRIFIKDRMTAEKVIKMYVVEVLPYYSLIEKKNEILFTDLNVIYKSCFGANSEKDIQNLKDIWKNSNEENKKAIWKWIDFFSLLSNKYHKKFMNNLDLTAKKEKIDKIYN